MQNESFELQLMCNSSLNREHYFEELSILRAIKVWGQTILGYFLNINSFVFSDSQNAQNSTINKALENKAFTVNINTW